MNTGTSLSLSPRVVVSEDEDELVPSRSGLHEVVFGPVATVIPYDGSPHGAVEIVPRGQGGLVSSVYSEDAAFTS